MVELINGFDAEQVVGNTFYLVLFVIIFDVLTGLLASARERKINSSISFNGLLTKVAELLSLVFVSVMDVYFQANGLIFKMGVGLLIIYEGISIIENFSRVGVNMDYIVKYFDKSKVDMKNKKGDNV